MIGEVFEQFLADPGLAEAHAIGNHHTIVARQDFARFLDSVLLFSFVWISLMHSRGSVKSWYHSPFPCSAARSDGGALVELSLFPDGYGEKNGSETGNHIPPLH